MNASSLSRRSGDRVRRARWAVLALLLAVTLFFLHILLERHQNRLVALHLGEPLQGEPVELPPGPTPEAPRRTWIETDAGCGLGEHVDVDDCYALAMALTAPELDVRGVGSVFGNVPLPAADSVTRALVDLLGAHGGQSAPVFRGADEVGFDPTAASAALARELARGPLVVLALGPLTNVATALRSQPRLARNLAEVVLVGGKRSGQWMHPGHDHFITFSDFNVARDPQAVRYVLATGRPVTLVPFEAALRVTLSPSDLRSIARRGVVGQWLLARSGAWMSFWRAEGGRDGFVPFDNAAVAYAIEPRMLRCLDAYATLETSPPWFGIGRPTELVVRSDAGQGRRVRYCERTLPPFDGFLMRRLGEASRSGSTASPLGAGSARITVPGESVH